MKIAWLGHHCYRIISDSGTTIITDPYIPYFSEFLMGDLRYDPLNESADIVTVSHNQHKDHSSVEVIRGKPEIVRGSDIRGATKRVKGIEFKCIPCFHDTVHGKWHGDNNIIYFEVDGIRFCHSGDLGHELDDEQTRKLGKIDILLLAVSHPGRNPSEYHYTVDTHVADALYDRVKPRVVLPGHYSNYKCTFKFAILDEFLDGKQNVIRLDTSEIEMNKEQLPQFTQIIVLKSVY
jgi:L-ascorbate metabolism protein UlaG (beta-lactamase superfamily)